MSAAIASIETQPAPDLRSQVRAELSKSGATQAGLARSVAIDKSALNQWLKGQYHGNNAKIEQALSAWIRREEPARIAAVTPMADKPSGFVPTPTSKAILQRLQWAHGHKVLVVIHGDAGVGKSMTCARYAEEHNPSWQGDGAIHVTMTSTIGSPRALLRRLATEIGLHEDEIPRETALFHDRVTELLRGRDVLLILDEFQHLQPKELEVVRGIYDAAGIGVALVGNEYSYSRFNSGRRAQYSQLVSRFDLILGLNGVRDGDVGAIAAAWGVTDSRALARLGSVAGRPGAGALRRVHKVLSLAHELAAKGGTGIGREHVERAALQYA